MTSGLSGTHRVSLEGVELVTARVVDVRTAGYLVTVGRLVGERDVTFMVDVNAPTLVHGDADAWLAQPTTQTSNGASA